MSRKKRKKRGKKPLLLVLECTHSRRVRGPVVSHCYECGMVGPDEFFSPPPVESTTRDAPQPPSTESMQLAAFDDDGGPPVSIPDVGSGAVEEGVPPSSGWRSREYASSALHLPVIVTTWEPYV